MKKIFLLITAIILFYAGGVSAASLSCEYGDNKINVNLAVDNGRFKTKIEEKDKNYTGTILPQNKLDVNQFNEKCPTVIYYRFEEFWDDTMSMYIHKYELYNELSNGNYIQLNLKNPGTSDGSGNGTGSDTTPGGNSDNQTGENTDGDNTENPSNYEVNVGFWGNLDVIQCGTVDVPAPVPPLVRLVVMALKIVTPFVLIIMGMVDMLKAVIGSKDDEIKKEQQKFIKRVIAAVLVFFVVSILQFVIGFIAPEDTDSVLKCVDCLINDASECGVQNNDVPTTTPNKPKPGIDNTVDLLN